MAGSRYREKRRLRRVHVRGRKGRATPVQPFEEFGPEGVSFSRWRLRDPKGNGDTGRSPRTRTSPVRFVAVRPGAVSQWAEALRPTGSVRLGLVVNGRYRIEVGDGFAAVTLARLVRALEQL